MDFPRWYTDQFIPAIEAQIAKRTVSAKSLEEAFEHQQMAKAYAEMCVKQRDLTNRAFEFYNKVSGG